MGLIKPEDLQISETHIEMREGQPVIADACRTFNRAIQTLASEEVYRGIDGGRPGSAEIGSWWRGIGPHIGWRTQPLGVATGYIELGRGETLFPYETALGVASSTRIFILSLTKLSDLQREDGTPGLLHAIHYGHLTHLARIAEERASK